MKSNRQYALLGAAFVAVGLLGINGVLGTPFGSTESIGTLGSNSPMMGHVTLVAHDADGNVIAYRQADNTIVDEGDNCMSGKIFELTSGAACANGQAPFDAMAIGTGGGACGSQPAQTVSILTTEATTGGAARVNATTSVLTPASASAASVAVEHQYSFTATFAIDEAGVFNSVLGGSGGGEALAIQCFTDINVNNGDTLTVTWTFTVGQA